MKFLQKTKNRKKYKKTKNNFTMQVKKNLQKKII